MLWLLVLVLIGGLSFVLFYKPHLDVSGAVRAPRQVPAPPADAAAASDTGEEAVTLRLSRDAAEDAVTLQMARQAPQPPDTVDLNELFGGKQDPGDRPKAS